MKRWIGPPPSLLIGIAVFLAVIVLISGLPLGFDDRWQGMIVGFAFFILILLRNSIDWSGLLVYSGKKDEKSIEVNVLTPLIFSLMMLAFAFRGCQMSLGKVSLAFLTAVIANILIRIWLGWRMAKNIKIN
jgi:phosphatidylserine synthase